MALYLAAANVKQAVQRLSASAAKGSLTDYLIFKRALRIGAEEARKTRSNEPKAVTTGTASEPFSRAIVEMAGCAPTAGGSGWTGLPYFSPFGAERDKGHGFKSAKYPSNGPSDTVGRWQSRGSTPLQLVDGSRPKQYTFTSRTPEQLAEFFLNTEAVAAPESRPSLAEAALWWFRFTDLEERFGKEPTAEELVAACVEDLGLAENEISGLFAPWKVPHDMAPLAFAAHPPPPPDILPAPSALQKQAEPARAPRGTATTPANEEERVASVVQYVSSSGFVFHPWQVAAFIVAARTKPFIILAGISGTGKTKLPRLVAEATGAEFINIPVRPDWTDSSDLLGYERLEGTFRPGQLLQVALDATSNPEKQYFVMLDEMNIARVEYYLAEVLSHIEERFRVGGRVLSKPLAPTCSDSKWRDVVLPSNVCIIGSVNMDESTQSFSKKVLDRAFVIEFSDIDLSAIGTTSSEGAAPQQWSSQDWAQKYLTLAEYPSRGGPEVTEVVDALVAINDCLEPAQLQIGYRVRDEIALFCANASACIENFTTLGQGGVDPLDLAVSMKILPRIQGSGAIIGAALERLGKWAAPATDGSSKRVYPYSAERIGLMLQRLNSSGFTSYWL